MLRKYLSIFTLLAATATAVNGVRLSGDNHIGRSPARRHPFGHGKSDIHQRGDDARFTWYVLETGNQVACGGYRSGGEYIVAMNEAQWHCGRGLTISYQGRQVHAVVADICPPCGYRDIDLSPAVFGAISDLGAGQIYGDWWWDGEGPSTPTTEAPPPPPPPTTQEPPPPTTTQTPTPTPSPSPSPSPTSTSDPILSVQSVTSATSSPTPTPTYAIPDLHKYELQLQQLLIAGFDKYSE